MKKLLIVLASLLAALVLIIAIALTVFDPNDYKSQISAAVKDATGRELAIDGAIGWQLFPSFGLSLADVSFANPQGFKEPTMASLKKLSVSVAVMPLLSGQVQIDGIHIEQVRLNLITLADGRDNLADLTRSSPQPEQAPQPDVDAATGTGLENLSLGLIRIEHLQLVIEDQKAKTHQKMVLDLFELSQFAPGQRTDIKVRLTADTADMGVNVAIDSSLTLATDFNHIDLHGFELVAHMKSALFPKGELTKTLRGLGTIQLDPMQVALNDIQIDVASLSGTGWFAFKQTEVPDVQFNLAFDTFALDDFIAKAEASAEQPVEKDVTQPAADLDAEPDLTGLNGIKLDGELSFKKVLASGLTIEDVVLHAALNKGILVASPIAAKLYQGALHSSVTLNASQKVASFQTKVALSGVQIQPLLQDLADTGTLAGTANFNLNLSGKGLSQNKLKQASQGQGNFSVQDGAVYGINLAQKIRSAKAALKGNFSEQPAEKKTDFSELTRSFTLANGIAKNPDLKMQSPLLRVKGEGQFNVLNNTVDYLATTELVASSKGQGGADAEELDGIKIPLKISGPVDDLDYDLDTDSALKEEAKQKLEQKKDKLKDKVNKKLGGLFGG